MLGNERHHTVKCRLLDQTMELPNHSFVDDTRLLLLSLG